MIKAIQVVIESKEGCVSNRNAVSAECVRSWDRVPPEVADDIAQADSDPDAAQRLGVRMDDLVPEMRLTELRNWVKSLRAVART